MGQGQQLACFGEHPDTGKPYNWEIGSLGDTPLDIPLAELPEVTPDMIREAVSAFPTVEVDTFDGLLVGYASEKSAKVILRGLRAVSDFEYELQMALMNRWLNPKIETFFMAPNSEYSFLSSGLVKEVASFGGDVRKLVPECVGAALAGKIAKPSD